MAVERSLGAHVMARCAAVAVAAELPPSVAFQRKRAPFPSPDGEIQIKDCIVTGESCTGVLSQSESRSAKTSGHVRRPVPSKRGGSSYERLHPSIWTGTKAARSTRGRRIAFIKIAIVARAGEVASKRGSSAFTRRVQAWEERGRGQRAVVS